MFHKGGILGEKRRYYDGKRTFKGNINWLNEKIEKMSTDIFSSKEKIQEFRKYMWENKGDMDVQKLTSVHASSEMEAKRLLDDRDYFKRLVKIQSSPYFASIRFISPV